MIGKEVASWFFIKKSKFQHEIRKWIELTNSIENTDIEKKNNGKIVKKEGK